MSLVCIICRHAYTHEYAECPRTPFLKDVFCYAMFVFMLCLYYVLMIMLPSIAFND